jgi:hypothetical protein
MGAAARGAARDLDGVSRRQPGDPNLRDSGRLDGEVSHVECVAQQFLPEQPPAAEEARLHRAHRDAEDLGELGVAQPVHVAEHDRRALIRRQLVDRPGDLLVEEGVVELPLRVRLADDLERGAAVCILR